MSRGTPSTSQTTLSSKSSCDETQEWRGVWRLIFLDNPSYSSLPSLADHVLILIMLKACARSLANVPYLSCPSPGNELLRDVCGSVFNAGCRAILGTINVEQFEREMMHQSPDVLDHDTDMEIDMGDDEQQFHEEEEEEEENVEDENMERDDGEGSDGDNQEENEQGYVWVEPPAAALGGGDVDAGDEGKGTDEDGNGNEENRRDGVAVGAGVRVGGGRQRRVSGKRARRDFESRRERQEQRRLAQEAFGQQDEWDEF